MFDFSQYLSNIASVDAGIKETVKLMEDFYGNDKKTAYLMTADHGMTDWGKNRLFHLYNARY